MNKIPIKFLDIPIIRSCNLSCGGCLTFSDSKKIKGLVNLEESHSWLEFWSNHLIPEAVTVFGGEPLLHPNFIEWCQSIRDYWPKSELRINTNGYYLDRLLDRVGELFTVELRPQFIVSIQTGHEPYYSIVKNHVESIKQKVLDVLQQNFPDSKIEWVLWLNEPEIFKEWWRIDIDGHDTNIRITTCEQFRIPWQAHYQGSETQLEPFYDYNDTWFKDNHKHCQAKNFINLYKGKIYKCPTVAVLEHTLQTYCIDKKPSWQPYLNNYKSLDVTATYQEMLQWFDLQQNPENVCNMCGFSGPNCTNGHINLHELKKGWKYLMINT